MGNAFISDSSPNVTQADAQHLQDGVLALLILLVQDANDHKPFPLQLADIHKAGLAALTTHIIRFHGDGKEPTEVVYVSINKRPVEVPGNTEGGDGK